MSQKPSHNGKRRVVQSARDSWSQLMRLCVIVDSFDLAVEIFKLISDLCRYRVDAVGLGPLKKTFSRYTGWWGLA